MPLTSFFVSQKSERRVALRPFVYAAFVVCILALFFAFFLAERTTRIVTGIMAEKGAAIITALESSMHSSKRSNAGLLLQFILEDLSVHPGVRFIALTMPDGTILAHTDPRRVGNILVGRNNTPLTQQRINQMQTGDRLRHTLMSIENDRTFVVYQLFRLQNREGTQPAPQQEAFSLWSDMPFSYENPLREDWFSLPFGDAPQPPRKNKDPRVPYVIVGLYPDTLYAASRHDTLRSMGMGGIFLFSGLMLVASAYGLARLRLYRRSQYEAEALAEELAVSLPDGLMLLDPKGRVVHINNEALRLVALSSLPADTKITEILPTTLSFLIKQLLYQDVPLLDTAISIAGPDNIVRHSMVRGGHVRGTSGEVLGIIIIMRDITEVRRLEGEVRRREKMAAVGNLAAGVAHELRNPLSSIKGYATYFAGRFAPDSEDRKAAHVMVSEVDRLNRVINDLIGFSRPTDVHLTPTNLAALLEDSIRLVRQEARPSKVRIHFASSLTGQGHNDEEQGAEYIALIDADRIRQVILNLCLNALDAMPNGGELNLALIGEEHDKKSIIRLDISDTGCGISSDDLPYIFDPYFTTKGHGTGLGLATVHKIMEAHKALIDVHSELGEGTVFSLHFERVTHGTTIPTFG